LRNRVSEFINERIGSTLPVGDNGMKRGIYIHEFDTYSLLPHLDLVYGRYPRRLALTIGFLRWEVEFMFYYKWEE